MRLLRPVTLSGCLASVTSALSLDQQSTPGVIGFQLQRRLAVPGESGHHSRAATKIPLLNPRYYTHEVNITLGTPPQPLLALLDTGSSSLVVLDPNSDLCKAHKTFCQTFGSYNANSSSTYKFLSDDMQANFLSGEKSTGSYATDLLQMGPIQIQNMQLGIMNKTSVSQNILGVGYTVVKDIVHPMIDSKPRENLLTLLVKQKHIESRAFSLWMNDLNNAGGEILFGGVDREKYLGELITLPFVERIRDLVVDFSVVLNNVQMTDPKGTKIQLSSKPTSRFALLDTGSSQTILPDDIVLSIYKKLGADLTNPLRPTVSCSMVDDKTTVDFIFDSRLVINVPLSQLIYRSPDDKSDRCHLWGLGKISDYPFNTIMLGSSFLSSAYVVFDLDNREASIAQSKFNSKSSNILRITSGGNAVPGAKKKWSGVPATGKTIDDWRYLGCAKETSPRTLDSASLVTADMTIESCQRFCDARNYRLSGLQSAKECFCGNALSNGGALGSPGCNSPCIGNPSQFCGGRDRISVFENVDYEPISNPPIVNGYGYFGCYQEKSTGRHLSGPFTTDDKMTIEFCGSFCREKDRSSVWAGLEHGRECFCGQSLPDAASPALETSCDMVCSGNKKQYCGGATVISLYRLIDSA